MAGNKLKRFTWNDVEIEDDVNKNDFSPSKPSKSAFRIEKADADKRLVFGWALVSALKDGQKIIDHQGDIVEQEDLEEGAYEYVLNFRDAGEEHIGTLRKKARMVESVVFTEEKLKAMGIPAGTVPYGWWIGFYVDDDRTWELIKNGTYKMFSIEGRAIREPVTNGVTKALRNFEEFPELGMWHEENLDATKEDLKAAKEYYDKKKRKVAKSFSDLIIEKFNPYHDSKGRFTSSGTAASFTYAPGKSKAHDLAIAREKERTANAAGAIKDGGKERIAAAETKLKAMLKDGAEVNLNGVDPELAESTVKSVQMVIDRYPTVKDAFGGFTTDEPEPGYFKDNQGTYACYSPGTGKIHMNLSVYSDKAILAEKYNKALSEQHFPQGTTAESAIVHEMGHAIDRHLSLKTIDNWKVNWGGETVSSRLWNNNIKNAKKNGEPLTGNIIKNGLSRYATKDAKEYFAEGFSEFMTSPNPRPMAQKVGKHMETYIKKAAKAE